MTRVARPILTAALLLVLVSPALVRGQQTSNPPNVPAAPPKEAFLKVDVTLSRWLVDKKTGSLPFTLWINTPGPTRASLRVGVDVPIGTNTTTTSRNPTGTNTTTTGTNATTEFRNVGTSIDCGATPMPDGRFQMWINLQDSSIFTSEGAGRGALSGLRGVNPAAFRTFSFSNQLPMRDGQTLQFATATDKLTNEVLKVDVTLTVMK